MSFGGPAPSSPPSDAGYGQPPQPIGEPSGSRAALPGQRFASALDRPMLYATPAPQVTAAPPLPVPVRQGRSVSVWIFGLIGFVLLALAAYFTLMLGAAASIVGVVLALVPLTIVLLGVRMIDKWEPEPKSLVMFALLWGVVAATGIAMLVDLLLAVAVGARNDFFTSVIQAPVVEELAKGFGVLIVFLIGRRAFDGPVDGVVYGALVGAGFAFTENVQYLAVSLIEGGAYEVTSTFLLRGLLSPFAHAMFTALTGYAIGLAARRGATTASALGRGAIGLLGAIALHAYWNGSALFGGFFELYITTQVPLFVGFIVAIVMLRREEARLTQQRLNDYAAAGWFTPEEVLMLATPAGRRAGMRWARTLRGDRRGLMREFIRDATALAAVRQRALTGRDPLAASDEHALLMRTRSTRAQLLAY